MHLFTPADSRPIHFMGIAGAGMSALALIARSRGVNVTGCDADIAGARAAGSTIFDRHDPSHIDGARAVVYTAAVPQDHPELQAAARAGVPVIARAAALQEIVSEGVVVGVSGTHGKTTTTAMATEAIAATGRHPTGIAGGHVAAWEGNARVGSDRLFVVEADEYDRAFLSLKPEVAIVNNVEADHLECYGSLEQLETSFGLFASPARRVLVGADDAGARRVARSLTSPVWLVGVAEAADIRLSDVRSDPRVSRARVTLPDGDVTELTVSQPGLHNLRNAAMALGAVLALGGAVEPALAALATFQGVGRRFEPLGTVRGISVVDDYAHHPSEVVATIAAARQRFPKSRLVAVFQPHLYTRTQALGTQMGVALSTADVAVVTEIYGAREKPISGVSGTIVARAARRAGATVEWVPEGGQLLARLVEIVSDGDVVLTLGAGDITQVGPKLLSLLTGAAA